MRRPLLALSALALAIPAAPASAAAASYHYGTCGWTAAGDVSGAAGGGFVGKLHARFVLFSTDGTDNPVSAAVTCTVRHATRMQGLIATYAATFSGTGAVVGAADLRLPGDVDPGDLYPCLTVDYTSDDTPTYDVCYAYAEAQFPPSEVQETADAALATVPGARETLCGALATAGPAGVMSSVSVNESGDVHLGRQPAFDC